MTAAAVEFRQLSWGPRGGSDILSDISFAVPQGQITAICGANGAGKSSLLRHIYRYQMPRRGKVLLMGRDVWRMQANEAARIVAAVLQEQPTDFALSVRQIVAMGRLPHRRGLADSLAVAVARDRAIIEAALVRMDLTHLAGRAFGTLSGGERQRVMMARALTQEPKVIVLDEPTNHLDIRHQLELLALLRGLGLTVIATLHDLSQVAEFADRVILLHRGRLLADGPPATALSTDMIATAFNVQVRIDRSGSSPRFSYHL